jgi:hypothetical protein
MLQYVLAKLMVARPGMWLGSRACSAPTRTHGDVTSSPIAHTARDVRRTRDLCFWLTEQQLFCSLTVHFVWLSYLTCALDVPSRFNRFSETNVFSNLNAMDIIRERSFQPAIWPCMIYRMKNWPSIWYVVISVTSFGWASVAACPRISPDSGKIDISWETWPCN